MKIIIPLIIFAAISLSSCSIQKEAAINNPASPFSKGEPIDNQSTGSFVTESPNNGIPPEPSVQSR